MPTGGIPAVRRGRRPDWQYISVFLLSMAALTLEISLTRVLSLVEWYHFAFMVVSIALFGYAAAGSLLSLYPRLRHDTRVPPASAALCSLSIVLSIFFSAALRFDPIEANARPMTIGVILLQYLALGLPFFFTGMCLASLVTRRPSKASLFYFSDLSGAGTGSLLALAIMPVGGPSLAILCAAFSATAAYLLLSLDLGSKRLIRAGVLGALALFLVSTAVHKYEPEISEYKALSGVMRNPDAEKLWTKWNSISRVDVVRSKLIHYAPGMPFDQPEPIPEQLAITVDGDNLEPITQFSGKLASLAFMLELPSAVAYEITPRENVLIIGAGGGFDVLVALANGALRVVGTEQNPSVVEAVEEVFADFSGGLYSREDVEIIAADARSYLSGTDEKFDLIEISLKQDPVTASVGLYSLSDSYLFTVEAFRSIFQHLSEDGVFVVTRWLSPPPRESARVVSIIAEALEDEGVDSPIGHIASFRTYLTVTSMVKRTPFTDGEISTLRTTCDERRFDLVLLPGLLVNETNRFSVFERPDYYNAFVRIMDPETRDGFVDDYFFDLSPPSDERPFYKDFLKWSRLLELRRALGRAWNPYLEGGLLVIAVLVQAAAISVLLILVPTLLAGRARQNVERKGRWVLYFVGLGAGYILVEVTLLQRFILLLGQPAYAMAAALFGMLVFSGLGSLWSSNREASTGLIGQSVMVILVLIVLGYSVLDQLISVVLGSQLWVKFVVSIGLIAPLAFAMGVPFPTGLRLLGRRSTDSIPLAYSANGCASVVGSAGSLIIATQMGYSNVLLVCAAIYVLTYLAVPKGRGG